MFREDHLLELALGLVVLAQSAKLPAHLPLLDRILNVLGDVCHRVLLDLEGPPLHKNLLVVILRKDIQIEVEALLTLRVSHLPRQIQEVLQPILEVDLHRELRADPLSWLPARALHLCAGAIRSLDVSLLHDQLECHLQEVLVGPLVLLDHLGQIVAHPVIALLQRPLLILDSTLPQILLSFLILHWSIVPLVLSSSSNLKFDSNIDNDDST